MTIAGAIKSPLATLAAILLGVGFSPLVLNKTYEEPITDVKTFFEETESGLNTPVIVESHQLNRFTENNSEGLWDKLQNGGSFSISEIEKIVIPDKYASLFWGCSDTLSPWFSGTVIDHTRIVHLGAQFTAKGALYQSLNGKRTLAARDITLTLRLKNDHKGPNIGRRFAYITYISFVADTFTTFLLALFLPTLGLSLLKAIVDFAGLTKRCRFNGVYFLVTGLLASGVGVIAGALAPRPTFDPATAATLAISGEHLVGDYDPHPILATIGRIIPTNPVQAFMNPTSNNALQVAFVVVVLGVILSSLRASIREQISNGLKKVLALLIKDSDLNWKSVSDYLNLFMPVGVFFVSLKIFGTLSLDLISALSWLLISILIAVSLYIVLLTYWVLLMRNWTTWKNAVLVPALPGLMTAFATASSYAALPIVSGIPGMMRPDKRAIFDLGTALSKNGTIIYIASASVYLGLSMDAAWFSSETYTIAPWIILPVLTVLAGIATTGIPIAAVFGMQLVLTAIGLPGGLAWMIAGIDAMVDGLVTCLNVFSNLVACSDPRASVSSSQNKGAVLAGSRVPDPGFCTSGIDTVVQ